MSEDFCLIEKFPTPRLITSICENYGISRSLQILLSKSSFRELKFDTIIKSEWSVLWNIHAKCKIELKVLHFRIKR